MIPENNEEEVQLRNEIGNLTKLQNYRNLKRNRDTKATSLFNAMTMRNQKKFSKHYLKLEDINSSTGLLW